MSATTVRRNRIKAVIKVPRSGVTKDPVRPVTPSITFNVSVPVPSIPSSPLQDQQDPVTPTNVIEFTFNEISSNLNGVGSSTPTTPSGDMQIIPYGGIQRPSSSESPSASAHRFNLQSPSRPSPSASPIIPNFPTLCYVNSNSTDSNEVARYMNVEPPPVPSPSKEIFANKSSPTKTPKDKELGFSERLFTPILAIEPPPHSQTGSTLSTEPRPRTQSKPNTTTHSATKYQQLKKELLNSEPPKAEKFTMLHYAIWNPAKKKRSAVVGSDDSSQENSPKKKKDGSDKSQIDENEDEGQSDVEVIDDPPADNIPVGPRVKVGPDGQLIIDTQSLLVETSESQRAKKQLSEMETVSGAEFIVGSSGIYRSKKFRRGNDWSIRDTVKFYRALSMCGSDFSMMSTLFPGRSRTELKSKFKREDKRNPTQINEALSCQEFDPEEGFSESEEEFEEIEISSDDEFSPTSKKDKLTPPVKLPVSKENKKEKTKPKLKETNPIKDLKEIKKEGVRIKKEKKDKKLPVGRPTAAWKSKVKLEKTNETSETILGS